MSAPLNLGGDVVELLRALIDIESVSGQETEIADRVEQALADSTTWRWCETATLSWRGPNSVGPNG